MSSSPQPADELPALASTSVSEASLPSAPSLPRPTNAKPDAAADTAAVERVRLLAVFQQSPSFLAILRGPENVFELVNAAYEQIIGHGRNVVGKALFDAIPETRGQGFDTYLGQVRETGTPLVFRDLPVMIERASGAALEERFIDITYLPLVEADGSHPAVIAHGTDVTEQVRARRAVEALLHASEQARRDAEEARGALIVANAHLEEETAERERQNQQLQDQAVELEIQNQQSQEQAVELEAQSEELRALTAHLEERTDEAERAVRALTDQERQLRLMLNAMPTLAWMARPDGFIDWYNARWYEYTGTVPEEMEGWGWQSVHDPAALPHVLDRWRSSIATGVSFEMTFPLRGADGNFRAFLTRVAPMIDADGQITRWFGTNTDVEAERVARRASERRSEDRLREQFEKLPVPTFLWEHRGEDFMLLDCNEAARLEMPMVGEAGLGQLHSGIFPDLHDIRAEFRRALRENVVAHRSVETDLGPPIGRRRIDLTIGPQQPDRLIVYALDVTERTELEAQLRQAQKMDAVGRLAGGVAHDFNNLLTVIGAHSAFLLESLAADDPQREDADAIHQAGLRAAGLTRQLLAFSRKQLLRPEVVDLNGIIDDARRMLERLLGETISIVTHLALDLPSVLADPTQLDQILVNLAVNARDAMPSGGKLTITTARVAGPQETDLSKEATSAIGRPGDYVELTVSDEGTGIDAATQARLFEPFFTTKEMGKGTGLGLATVYGIVKQSGGYVRVDSAPGAGTAFRIYLPMQFDQPSKTEQASSRAGARGDETILLVEDEAGVRAVAQHMLERLGYRVLEADSGLAALTLAFAVKHPIDLVLSDVVMPHMHGAEVVRRLQLQRPGIKAVFMSGYTDDEILRQGIISAAVAFVHKPFTADDLAHAVRAALDAPVFNERPDPQ